MIIHVIYIAFQNRMGHKKTIRGSGQKQHLKKAFAAEENEDKQALKKDVSTSKFLLFFL